MSTTLNVRRFSAKALLPWWDHILLAVLTSAYLLFLWHNRLPFIEDNAYLDRDLQRTFWLLKHGMVWIGPDLNQGFYCLGPFFYFLLLPLVALFGNRPEPVAVLVLVLYVLAFIFTATILTRLLRLPRSLIFFILASSQFLFGHVYWLNNASFIFVCLPGLFWLLWRYLQSSEKEELPKLILFGIALALALQIHLVFLYLLVYLVGMQLWKSRDTTAVLKHLLIVASCAFVCSLPYIIAFVNDRWLHAFDGPHFHSLFTNLREFFTANYSPLNGINRWLYIPAARTPGESELMMAVAYFVLRIIWTTYSTRRRPTTAVDAFIFTTGLLLLLCIFPLLFSRQERYNLVLFTATFAIALFDFALLLRQIRPLYLKALLSCAICLFLFNRTFLPSFRPLLPYPRQDESNMRITDLAALCAYFNAQGIAYDNFRSSTFELETRVGESSIALINYCFSTRQSQDNGELRQLLLAKKKFVKDYPNAPILRPKLLSLRKFLPELEIEKATLTPLTETFSYVLFAVDYGKENQVHKPVSNLASPYALDAGLALYPQLKAFAKSSFFTDFAASSVDLFEARICTDPVYCSIYALMQRRAREIRLLLVSRPLQVVWHMPPLSARLDGVSVVYSCSGEIKSQQLASRMGTLGGPRPFDSVYAPLKVIINDACAGSELRELKVERGTVYVEGKSWQDTGKNLAFQKISEVRGRTW